MSREGQVSREGQGAKGVRGTDGGCAKMGEELLSEHERVRRQSRQVLMDRGVDPYPAATFKTNTTAQEIVLSFDKDPEAFSSVRLAGRLMSRRVMGAASFAELLDHSGRVQLYVKRDSLCPTEDKSAYNDIFKRHTDIGDIVGVEGFVFRTQKQEITLHVRQLVLLSKALRPLPVVKEHTDDTTGEQMTHDAFTDPEQRYRQRYVDLVVNPQVKEVFQKRTQLVSTVRQELNERGYLEVETPILQPIWGGATAKPFVTHHHTLKQDLYLRIANELYLKRLIVGGFRGVYELSKDFRNEGMSRFHNPEFTQMELYVAYKDYLWMADFTEELIEKVALALHGSTEVQVGEHKVSFKRPWHRKSFYELLREKTGEELQARTERELKMLAKKHGISLGVSDKKGKILDHLFSELCEKHLVQPTFVMDHPVELSPLAKGHRQKKGVVERFEVVCCGREICNAYSELNDPVEQRVRFEEQLAMAQRGDEEAMALDEDFLQALSYGMPPTAGLGVGIDRLTMLMTNSPSIQDVLFFPQMRAQQP